MQYSLSLRERVFSDLGILILLAFVITILHTGTNGQYGFHRDELDTLDNARYLDWGYVAYPPVTPFIGRIALELFGTSLVGVRFFAALSQGLAALLVGLMARGLGGKRNAQIVSVTAVALSPVAMTSGLMLHYLAFDYLWWVLVATCMVYLLKTDNPRWWLGVGLGIGLGMMTKYTMAIFAAGIVGGVLLTHARRYLFNRWLWAGVALSLLIFAPNLVWQIQHHFVSLDFLNAIRQRDLLWGRSAGFLIEQLYNSINPFTIPLWVAGLYFCFRNFCGRFRPLVWMFVIPFILFLLMQGRSYYLAPAYPMLIAAGTVWAEAWLSTRTIQTQHVVKGVSGVTLLGSGLLVMVLTLPITPLKSSLWNTANSMTDNFREMIGWPELVASVASVYQKLPDGEKTTVAILTGNYGETGALSLYGAAYGLPTAISGVDSAWYRGYGDPPPETVIVVGNPDDGAAHLFQSCTTAARVRNVYSIQNEESLHSSIQICRNLRKPWEAIWESLQRFQ